jgi:hypothetical protein
VRIRNRPARLNRTVLFIAGLVLLAAGLFELGTGYGLIHLVPRHQGLSVLAARRPHWVAPAVFAGAVVTGLAALRWLVAQLPRRHRAAAWRLAADPDRGVTTMPADAATAPLAAEVAAYPGVTGATARLTGPPRSPELYLHVRTDYDADIGALRREIAERALPRLRYALELDDLPSAILITPTSARTRAVS